MTGFGRAEGPVGSLRASVEISSLNHRNREVHVHLPPRWGRFDPLVRRVIQAKVQRGKVRVVVRIPEEDGGGGARYVYRPEVAEVYQAAFDDLCRKAGEIASLGPQQLLFARGVVAPVEADEGEPDENEKAALRGLLEGALDRLVESRTKEGAVLRRDLEERLADLENLASKYRQLLPRVRELLRDRFRSRIQDLMQNHSMPEERLLTEAALYIDRCDVHEELVRLEAHVAAFAETLAAGGAKGRRLAFLGQEMNREANTLGAKSLDPEASQLAVAVKDEVAKVREQVENLE